MKSVSKICDELRYWINWYEKCNQVASIEELLNIQDQVAIRTFTLAKYVGDYKTSYNASYFIRQIGIAKSSLQHQKNGLKIATAKDQALVDNAEKYEQENEMEATAVTMDLMLRQTNKILDGMAQRISYLKQEKMRVNNQNQT